MAMKFKLAIILVAIGLLLSATSTASGKGGPKGPATLVEKGWLCVADESGGLWAHCVPPGQDIGSVPPSIVSLNFATFDLTEDAPFVGTEVLIRADLFHDQPCPQGTHGGTYEFVGPPGLPPPGYFSCHHFSEPPFP